MPLLKTLHVISSQSPLSPGFFGLYTPSSNERWLLPLELAQVQQVDWHAVLGMGANDDLPGFLEVAETGLEKEGGKKRVIEVKITHRGESWRHSYTESNRKYEMGGNALEVRLWPNFCFPVAPRVPPAIPDRVYYFRIRQNPAWQLSPLALARVRDGDGRVTGCELLRLATSSELPQAMDRFRRANFHSLPAEGARRLDGSRCDGHAEPIGIYFENKGLLLFRLPTLSRSGHPRGAPWRAGIDFGTSNTCVAFLALGASMKASPRLERFEIQTAAMHYAPTYEKISKWDAGQQSEGAAAIFDFPYRYGSEALLTEQFYFPTQFVTRLDGPPQEPDFRFEHGFVFPRNAVLDSYDAKELLDGHPPLPENEYRVFRLVQDVKWSNRAYRKAFLWHLYKILILHAARHGAYLADVVFSFPRAFDPDSVRRYKNEVSEIFTKHGGIPLHSASFVSESVAVQRRVGSEKLRADKIVLDVGGGTSDYTGLLVAAPPFQASYCLAARYVNKYFQAAPSLRAALRDAAYQVLGQAQPGKQQDQRSLLDDLLKELHVLGKEQLGHEENGRTANYSQAAFFGLLGMVNDAQFSGMSRLLTDSKTKRPEAERKSLCGFFLTLVVLYSALACQAARLLQQHRRRSANLKLDFIGNGSRYLLLLNGEAKSAHRLLERVVQSVWPTPGQGERPLEVRTEISASGKTFVAEGLVLEHDGTAPAEVLPDLDSVKQFSALLDGRSVGRVIPGDELGWFVDLLGQCLPGGKLEISPGTAITLIPFSQPDLRGELTPLARSAVIKARELVPDNMKEYVDWQRQQAAGRSVHASVELAEKEAAHAVEPIFITCVRCLLDEVRQEYAA